MDREKLKKRYDETRAGSYNKERSKDTRWVMEDDAVTRLLDGLAPGSRLMDVPVGTGRFIPLYKDLQLAATGVDASTDMLKKAQEVADESDATVELKVGDVFALDAVDDSFDAVVCMRFLNWIETNDLAPIFREFSRVSGDRVIIAIERYMKFSLLDYINPAKMRLAWLHLKRRFFMWRTRSGYVYHKPLAVDAALQECGLKIVEQIEIKRVKDEGIEYFVYHLESAS